MADRPHGTGALVEPPAKAPWYLRPALYLARRITGKDPLPARLLAHHPKSAIAGGLLEALAAHAPADLDARTLKLARLSASLTTGCPFCIDMNAAGHDAAGVGRPEIEALLEGREPEGLSERERSAIAYARALSLTPVVLEETLTERLRAAFTPREIVALTAAIAQVNYWARLNQGFGVPAAGFFEGCIP